MHVLARTLLAAGTAMLLLACEPRAPQPGPEPREAPEAAPPEPDMQNPPDSRAMLERAVDAARHDLARRQAVDSERIEVVEAKPVTWPNGAMGCPEPGGMYTQALVPGVKIILRSGERRFHYHGRRDGEPFLCPEDRVQSPAPGEKPET